MKKLIEKLFDKGEPILVYLNDLPFLVDSLEIKEDKFGKYLIAMGEYSIFSKRWLFRKKKTYKVYVDGYKIRYMEHNLLKKL